MQLIFQNDHVVINLVGVLFGGCYRRSYFELCVCARGQWKVRILRIGEHAFGLVPKTSALDHSAKLPSARSCPYSKYLIVLYGK